MRQKKLIGVLAVSFGSAATLFISSRPAVTPPPPYNPYPAGILPSDIAPELAQVQGEFKASSKYFARLQLLMTPTVTLESLNVQGTGYESVPDNR
jgi:hypothetical protein